MDEQTALAVGDTPFRSTNPSAPVSGADVKRATNASVQHLLGPTCSKSATVYRVGQKHVFQADPRKCDRLVAMPPEEWSGEIAARHHRAIQTASSNDRIGVDCGGPARRCGELRDTVR
jgi:hypothetical protein